MIIDNGIGIWLDVNSIPGASKDVTQSLSGAGVSFVGDFLQLTAQEGGGWGELVGNAQLLAAGVPPDVVLRLSSLNIGTPEAFSSAKISVLIDALQNAIVSSDEIGALQVIAGISRHTSWIFGRVFTPRGGTVRHATVMINGTRVTTSSTGKYQARFVSPGRVAIQIAHEVGGAQVEVKAGFAARVDLVATAQQRSGPSTAPLGSESLTDHTMIPVARGYVRDVDIADLRMPTYLLVRDPDSRAVVNLCRTLTSTGSCVERSILPVDRLPRQRLRAGQILRLTREGIGNTRRSVFDVAYEKIGGAVSDLDKIQER